MLDLRTPVHGNDVAELYGTPLQVGDAVVVQNDALVELARSAPGLPPTWLMLPAGTEGKLVGWRDKAGESFAVVEVRIEPTLVVFVREVRLRRAPKRLSPPPLVHRRTARIRTRHRR